MIERSWMKKEILLCGISNGEIFRRKFQIVRKLKSGASVLCYEACHENSGNGVLTNFGPMYLA